VYLVRSSDIMYQLLNCGPAAAPSRNWNFVGSKLMLFLYSPFVEKREISSETVLASSEQFFPSTLDK
jgi:hypothetical protein